MNTTTEQSKLIDGKAVSQRILDEAAEKVRKITTASGTTPGLATVLVGEDPASATYVKMKVRRCENAGMKSFRHELAAETTTDELVSFITQLGNDPTVHGILLQHPVPSHIDERAAFEAIPIEKDVDGVTAGTLGRVALEMPAYGSCTPAGIMTLLDAYEVDLVGAHAVVIGRSPILGKPMSAMLLNRHATVTTCHSRTRNLGDVVKLADVVVAAVGRPKFVQGNWIKPGAVVIDAGYNEGNVGDVDFDAALSHAHLITPVPGGVGPMTLATLIDQTANAAAQQLGVTL